MRRPTTVRVSTGDAEVSAHDLVESLEYLVNISDISCVQLDVNKTFLVTLASAAGYNSVMAYGDLDVGNVLCAVKPVEETAVFVHVRYLPFEVTDLVLRQALEPYGIVHGIRREQYLQFPVCNGNRVVRMSIESPIPSYLSVGGNNVLISYRGQEPTCRRCHQLGHFVRNCPQQPRCFNCRTTGHVSRDCPQPRCCRQCGSPDHLVANCVRSWADIVAADDASLSCSVLAATADISVPAVASCSDAADAAAVPQEPFSAEVHPTPTVVESMQVDLPELSASEEGDSCDEAVSALSDNATSKSKEADKSCVSSIPANSDKTNNMNTDKNNKNSSKPGASNKTAATEFNKSNKSAEVESNKNVKSGASNKTAAAESNKSNKSAEIESNKNVKSGVKSVKSGVKKIKILDVFIANGGFSYEKDFVLCKKTSIKYWFAEFPDKETLLGYALWHQYITLFNRGFRNMMKPPEEMEMPIGVSKHLCSLTPESDEVYRGRSGKLYQVSSFPDRKSCYMFAAYQETVYEFFGLKNK